MILIAAAELESVFADATSLMCTMERETEINDLFDFADCTLTLRGAFLGSVNSREI